MTRHDERVRPAHASLHGKIFRYNDPIWKSVYPPNGWNCRCYVTPLTLEEMQAEGTYVPPVESEHHRTEFIKTVPEEFRRNPGLEEHIFTKWAEQKFKDMPIEKADEIKRKVEELSNIYGATNRGKTVRYKELLIESNTIKASNKNIILYDYETEVILNDNIKIFEANKSLYLKNKELLFRKNKPDDIYHEIGHAIDAINISKYYRGNELSKKDEFKELYNRYKDQVALIIKERILGDEYTAEIKYLLKNSGLNELKKILGSNTYFSTNHSKYLRTSEEIFAESYKQFRTNREKLENFAPDFYKYFIDIKSKIK